MTAAYASSAAQAVANLTANVTVTKPSGVAAGDLLVAFAWANNGTAAWTPPVTPAWTTVLADTATGIALFSRMADGTEGADFLFVRSNVSGAAGVIMVRLTGAHSVQAGSRKSQAASSTIDLTALTAAADNLLLQIVTSLNTTADSWSGPGSASLRFEGNANGTAIRCAIGDEVVGAGSTGVRTWTHTNGQGSRGAMFAINPAPTIAPSGIAPTAAVGSATVAPGAVDVTPGGIAPTVAAGTPTLAPGEVAVQPSGIAPTGAVGSPDVETGEATVGPEGIAPSTAVGQPAVAPGAVDVAPAGIAPTGQVGAPEVAGETTIQPSGIDSTGAVGDPTITAGAADIAPEGIAPTAELGAPDVAHTRDITIAATIAPSKITAGIADQRVTASIAGPRFTATVRSE